MKYSHPPARPAINQPHRLPISLVQAASVIGLLAAHIMLDLLLDHPRHPGGDARTWYLFTPWLDRPNSFAWVHLITQPLARLPWPFGYYLLIALSLLAALLVCRVFAVKNWWVVLFSAPLLANNFFGQIEIFPLVGVALAWLVWKKRLPAWWLGAAWLCLLSKPQTGLGVALLLTWWIFRDLGLPAIWRGLLTAAAVFALTWIIWPFWPMNTADYLLNDVSVVNNSADASIMPWGLLALPIAMLPLRIQPHRRLRMFAAAALLASPHINLYGYTLLLALTDYGFALPLSYLTFLTAPVRWESQFLAWTLPAAILLVDAGLAIRHARQEFGGSIRTALRFKEVLPLLCIGFLISLPALWFAQSYDNDRESAFGFPDVYSGCTMLSGISPIPLSLELGLPPSTWLEPDLAHASPDQAAWHVMRGQWLFGSSQLVQLDEQAWDSFALVDAYHRGPLIISSRIKHHDGTGRSGLLFNTFAPTATTGGHLVQLDFWGRSLSWGYFDDHGTWTQQGQTPTIINPTQPQVLRVITGDDRYAILVNNRLIVHNIPIASGAGYAGVLTNFSAASFPAVEIRELDREPSLVRAGLPWCR